MIIDHRTYTLRPNTVGEYLNVFEKLAMPTVRKHVGEPIGFFVTTIGPINQVVHLWGYEDFADMERRRAARDADPAWPKYRKKAMELIVSQENKILKPASFSPIK